MQQDSSPHAPAPLVRRGTSVVARSIAARILSLGVFIVLASSLLGACAESRTLDRLEELDPGTRIAELTDAEWESFCQWQEDLFVDRQGAAEYTCESDGLMYSGSATACVMTGPVRDPGRLSAHGR